MTRHAIAAAIVNPLAAAACWLLDHTDPAHWADTTHEEDDR